MQGSRAPIAGGISPRAGEWPVWAAHPQGGQITFTNVCTSQGTCPDQMEPTFSSPVTINVFQDGTQVFSGEVPLD
jgi:hypothetical protein